MRASDVAQLSTRMFKTNPLRTWLTILGMGVGTGAVVILVGLGFGLQKIILEEIVFGEQLLSLDVSNPASGAVELNLNTINQLGQIDNVINVAPRASFPALITYEGLTGNVFLQGIDPEYLSYAGVGVVSGDAFEVDIDENNTSEVLISQSVLKLFGIEKAEEIVGKEVAFRVLVASEIDPTKVREIGIQKRYRVKGVSNEEGSLTATMMLGELGNYVEIRAFDRAQVRVESNEFLDPVEAEIVEDGFRVTALSKTVEQATKIFQGLQFVLAAFGGIALVVSAIGMFNTMTVTLLQRTKEIGIMRTIGASPFDIKLLFVTESIVVGFLGGVVGMSIGVAVGLTMNFGLNQLAQNFGGEAVSLFYFPFWFLAFIAIFSAVVGYLTGIFPARRAASLNPLDAIRYE
jgi:putative ABC transport system permease protein